MDSSVEESKDLKEHMVGILFSQSKLTHLQKQVIYYAWITNKKYRSTVERVLKSNQVLLKKKKSYNYLFIRI